MVLAPSIIREEHRSLSAVSQSLRTLAREARDRKRAPDLELFTLILDYIESFLDRFHHPKEDEYLFAALRRKTTEARGTLDVLEGEHACGGELTRNLRVLLSRCRVGGPAAIEAFVVSVEAYVEFHWRHMRLEEEVILPLAERTLAEEDWQLIDAAFRANGDSIFGARPRAEFRKLFELIVNRAPVPVGVGPGLTGRRHRA